jgi:hypothetical protein
MQLPKDLFMLVITEESGFRMVKNGMKRVGTMIVRGGNGCVVLRSVDRIVRCGR